MSFRVKVNPDGSFGVFNPSTDEFLCKIPSPKFPPQLRKVQLSPSKSQLQPGILRSAVSQKRSSQHHVSKYGRKLTQRFHRVVHDSDSESASSLSTLQTCSDSSEISSLTQTTNEGYLSDSDPDPECIDDILFMRTNNLVQSERLREPELSNSFPLRLVSKRNPFKNPQMLQKIHQKRINHNRHKIIEKVDVASPLVQLVIRDVGRYHYEEEVLEKIVARYERFCIPGKVSTKRDPRIPVTFRERSMRGKYVRLHSMGPRQRRQQYLTLSTGLSATSRRLLGRCKPLQVKLQRLSQEEIEGHTCLSVVLKESQHLNGDSGLLRSMNDFAVGAKKLLRSRSFLEPLEFFRVPRPLTFIFARYDRSYDTSCIILEDVLLSLRRKYRRFYYRRTNLSVRLPREFFQKLCSPAKARLRSRKSFALSGPE